MLFLQTMVATVLLLLSVAAAHALPLPPYHIAGDLLFNLSPPNRIFPDDFGAFSLVDARFGSVSLTASGTPLPSLVADALIGPSTMPSIFGRGDELLEYAFEILGPPGVVPVLIGAAGVAAGAATSGASFAVESRWDLLDNGSPLIGDDIRSGQIFAGTFSQSFGHTVGISLQTNHRYSVFILADAAAAATDEGSHANGHASIDPVFAFGPGVEPLSYTFTFSDGIGNASPAAVAEPQTLTLLSAGFFCLSLRRLLRYV